MFCFPFHHVCKWAHRVQALSLLVSSWSFHCSFILCLKKFLLKPNTEWFISYSYRARALLRGLSKESDFQEIPPPPPPRFHTRKQAHTCACARAHTRTHAHCSRAHTNSLYLESNSNNILYSSQREIKAVVRSHNEEHISIILSHEILSIPDLHPPLPASPFKKIAFYVE